MLTSAQTRRAASTLISRYGTTGIAAAVLQAQRAAQSHDTEKMTDWQRIAEQALRRSSLRRLASS